MQSLWWKLVLERHKKKESASQGEVQSGLYKCYALGINTLLMIQEVDFHNILESTTRVTFFNSGFNSDPTKIFSSIELVTLG